MQANWSLILNVLLLIGVIVAIGRLMKARRQTLSPEKFKPSLEQVQKSPSTAEPFNDDIIAVRKVLHSEESKGPQLGSTENFPGYASIVNASSNSRDSVKASIPFTQVHQPGNSRENPYSPQPRVMAHDELGNESKERTSVGVPSMVMMFLLAKENRQFAGYELLQTVLAAGLRFGEGQIFHRHQFINGQGPVLCSLAAATASGVFDLHNMGAFTVRGLCLFMHASKNPNIDAERFSIMLETAKQLSEGLDAHLLDNQRKPLTEEGIERYKKTLFIDDLVEC